MDQKSESIVGPQIRKLRNERGLSLRALAELCGISANAISLIERGKNSPTVSSLHQLARALNVPITDFFENEVAQRTVLVKRNQGIRYRNESVHLENLGAGLRNQQLEPFRLTIASVSESCEEPVSHPGQEFIYCLDGTIEYYVNGQQYFLEAGDSLLFHASQQHCWRNTKQEPATILLIFQVANDQHLAHLSHLETG